MTAIHQGIIRGPKCSSTLIIEVIAGFSPCGLVSIHLKQAVFFLSVLASWAAQSYPRLMPLCWSISTAAKARLVKDIGYGPPGGEMLGLGGHEARAVTFPTSVRL